MKKTTWKEGENLHNVADNFDGDYYTKYSRY